MKKLKTFVTNNPMYALLIVSAICVALAFTSPKAAMLVFFPLLICILIFLHLRTREKIVILQQEQLDYDDELKRLEKLISNLDNRVDHWSAKIKKLQDK